MGILNSVEILTDIIMVLIGIIVCFFGYKAFKASITIGGAVIGYQFGNFIATFIGNYRGEVLSPNVILVLEIVFALLYALLAFKFYKRSIVLIVAFFVGQFIFNFVMSGMNNKINTTKDTLILIGICAVIGIAIGILSIYVQKWIVIAVSSIGGAKLLSIVLSKYLIGFKAVNTVAGFIVSKNFGVTLSELSALTGLLTIVLAVLGLVIQSKNSKRA